MYMDCQTNIKTCIFWNIAQSTYKKRELCKRKINVKSVHPGGVENYHKYSQCRVNLNSDLKIKGITKSTTPTNYYNYYYYIEHLIVLF